MQPRGCRCGSPGIEPTRRLSWGGGCRAGGVEHLQLRRRMPEGRGAGEGRRSCRAGPLAGDHPRNNVGAAHAAGRADDRIRRSGDGGFGEREISPVPDSPADAASSGRQRVSTHRAVVFSRFTSRQPGRQRRRRPSRQLLTSAEAKPGESAGESAGDSARADAGDSDGGPPPRSRTPRRASRASPETTRREASGHDLFYAGDAGEDARTAHRLPWFPLPASTSDHPS